MTNELKIKILHFLTEVQPSIKDERLTEDLRDIRQEITGCIPYFDITGVSRDDLIFSGFVGKLADDATMERLASKMADDYCEQLYHTSLEIIAEHLEIPRWFQIRDRLRGFCDDILNSTFDGDERGRIAWTDGVLKSLGDKEEYNAPTDTTDVNIALNNIIRSLKEYNDKSVLTDYEPLVEGLRSFVNAQIY